MGREMKSTLFTIPSHGGSGVPQTIVAMIQLPRMLGCLCRRATALATANRSENGLVWVCKDTDMGRRRVWPAGMSPHRGNASCNGL